MVLKEVKDGLTNFTSRFGKAVKARETKLGAYGYNFLTDVTLKPRIDGVDAVMCALEDENKTIYEKVNMVNKLVHVVAMPWGGEGRFGELMAYWESIMVDWNNVKSLRNSDIGLFTASEVENNIKWWGENETIPYGMIIVNLSFKDKHTSNSMFAMIQSMVVQPGSDVETSDADESFDKEK